MCFMEYSPEFKKNFATAYLAGEYEHLEKEAADARASAGTDTELMQMAGEDEVRIRARQKDILAEIEQILAKEKEEVAKPVSVVREVHPVGSVRGYPARGSAPTFGWHTCIRLTKERDDDHPQP